MSPDATPKRRGVTDHGAANRKAAERQRKRNLGLVRMPDLWVHPDDQERVKSLVAELNRSRQA